MIPRCCQLPLLVLVLAAGAAHGPAAAADRPNVLFLSIDDLRPELGCYGEGDVHSPRIDELAAASVRFDRAYCQVAVCNPSRVSLLTGLRPDSARVWTLDVRFRETVPDVVTLPQHFKQNGYAAVSHGKIFHNPWPDNASWSEPHSWPKKSRLWSEEAKQALEDFREEMRAGGKSEAAIERLRARATEAVDYPEEEHIDAAIATQGIASLRRLAKGDDPFFLAVGFIRPHLPFVVPRKYWDLYDRDEIELATDARLPGGAPPFEIPYGINTMYELRDYFDYLDTPSPTEGSLTEAQQRELKHGYLASVSFVDAQVGRLLDELSRLGLDSDTIVVLWSDHGWKLGEHNSWCKQTNYEIDTRVPLLVRDPRREGNGQATPALVELVDLYPTLCELAGLPRPGHLEGDSFASLLDDPAGEGGEAAFSQFYRKHEGRQLMGYAMRTDRHRYVEWIDWKTREIAARELYDHESDPGELRNLAGRGERRDRIEALHRRMWDELSPPPNLPIRPAKKEVGEKAKTPPTPGRPRITFRNEGDDDLEISWLPAGGDPRPVGTLKPGRSRTQVTTLGHVFRIAGPGPERTVTVTRAKETIVLGAAKKKAAKAKPGAPDIVVIMGDDWSWPHASIHGDPVAETPAFDRIAREGVLFEHAFTPAPSCTPARHAVSSGQHPWRLGEGVNLGGSIGRDVPVYPDLLAAAGYRTGFSRKGTGPTRHEFRGNDPFGERHEDFATFLDGVPAGTPFCYWYGAGEPHRPYEWRKSRDAGIDPGAIEVPPFLPDNDTTRADLGDYYLQVRKLDRLAAGILDRLEEAGRLENTLVIMTGDNGMPFPRAKATLYDSGTRVPLAIRWGKRVPGDRRVTDFVSLADLAPTILEACGLPLPETMTGHSLLPLLESGKSGAIDPERDAVLTGMERHVYPNPSRAIRTRDWLYIRNFVPEAWPTGETGGGPRVYDFAATPWPTEEGAFSHNIDPGPTKQWMRLHDSPQDRQAFGPRPAEELYALGKDPHQLENLLAGRTTPDEVATTRKDLSGRLDRGLRASGDPRFSLPGHARLDIHGWTIHLADRLWTEEADPTRRMLELLDGQLRRVTDVVPGPALAKLRQIPIWINPPYEGKRGTAEYHPERGWLEKNGRDPAMARAVEITNVRNFPFENRRMPYLLLHELAHGYHDRVLPGGYGNRELRAAYDRAKDSGTYDEVDRFDGNRIRRDKAYALSTPMEYFAESSEAYFGKNDFYPFTRDELKSHDPRMFELLERLWTLTETQ